MPSVSLVPGSRWRTGTGSPEGVVTAPVGTVWTDTNATFGAVEWTKFTGAGTTGWRVTKGDTGVVDVTAQCTIAGAAPVAGDVVEAQRTPYHVTVRVELAGRAAPASPLLIVLPQWARPTLHRSVGVGQNNTIPSRLLISNTAGTLYLYSLGANQTTQVQGLTLSTNATATPWRTA